MVDDVEFADLKTRVAQLEEKVSFLMSHLNLQFAKKPTTTLYPDVAELKRKGNLIEAIKVYRSHTNASLLEAKTFVENMEV